MNDTMNPSFPFVRFEHFLNIFLEDDVPYEEVNFHIGFVGGGCGGRESFEGELRDSLQGGWEGVGEAVGKRTRESVQSRRRSYWHGPKIYSLVNGNYAIIT